MTVKISLEKLIENGAHFGHQTRRWNPKMKEYIYGEQDGSHIFDLVKTKAALEEALGLLEEAAKKGQDILLLGTKKQVKDKIVEVAQEAGVFWVSERWLGGTITNFDQIQKSIRKLADLKKNVAEGEYKEYTKKERLLIDREIARLDRFFGGISELNKNPDLMFIVDTKREVSAVKEARMKEVATIGIVDTNSDPAMVDCAVPMNDDATKALSYVLDLVGEAIMKGKKGGKSKAKKTKKKVKKEKKKSKEK